MRKKYEKKAKKPEYCRGCIHEKDDPCRYIHSCPYFQTGIAKRRSSKCIGCPYGKGGPCVGFCMKSILKKDQKEEAGEDHAG